MDIFFELGNKLKQRETPNQREKLKSSKNNPQKLKQINSAFGIFCKIIDFVVQKLRFFESTSILFTYFLKKFSKTTQARSLISGPISNPDPGLNIFRSATTRTHTKQTEKLSKQSRHFTENVGKANTHDMTMFHDYFWALIFRGQIVAEAAIP